MTNAPRPPPPLDDAETLWRALNRLPGRTAQLLVFRYVEGRSAAETGALYGVAPEALALHLLRALCLFDEALSADRPVLPKAGARSDADERRLAEELRETLLRDSELRDAERRDAELHEAELREADLGPGTAPDTELAGTHPRGARARAAESGGTEPRGAGPRGTEPRAAGPRGTEPRAAGPRGERPSGAGVSAEAEHLGRLAGALRRHGPRLKAIAEERAREEESSPARRRSDLLRRVALVALIAAALWLYLRQP